MMKKLTASLAFLTLTACGFTPMHSTLNVAGDTVLSDVQISVLNPEDIAQDEGAFWLEQALYDRLGMKADGPYQLILEPNFFRAPLGFTDFDIASRYDMRMTIVYSLSQISDGKVLDRGVINSVSSFTAPTDPYSRESAEKAAMKNVAKDAADRLIIRMASYFDQAE